MIGFLLAVVLVLFMVPLKMVSDDAGSGRRSRYRGRRRRRR